MTPDELPRDALGEGYAGRVVPIYAVTGGRTRSAGGQLPIESLVTVTDRAAWAQELRNEYRVIIDMGVRLVSLVEIGAALRVPVGVVRVLVSDLVVAGYVVVHAPPPSTADGTPTPAVLTRLLAGLRER
jgi:hypothetical protein